MTFVGIAGILFTYLASSLAIFLLVARVTDAGPSDSVKLLFLTLGLGPMMISLLLWAAYAIAPGREDGLYMTVIVAVFFLAVIYSWRAVSLFLPVVRAASGLIRDLRVSRDWLAMLIALGAAVLVGAGFLLSLGLPVLENDALQYTYVSSLAYERRTFDFYPLVTADPESGFYATSSHPPAYYFLIVWSYMLQGTSEYAGFMKFISPFYTLYTLLLLCYLLSGRGFLVAALGMFLFIATPHYFSETMRHSIDPLRIHMLFLSFLWLRELLSRNDSATLFFVGTVVGLSMYAHSIGGLLTYPFFVAIYLIFARGGYRGKMTDLATVGAVALAVGGWQYLTNVFVFGVPIQDSLPIYERVPELDRESWVLHVKGLTTFGDRILNGALMGFTNLWALGPAYWLAAAYLILNCRAVVADSTSRIFVAALILFYAFVLLTVILGIEGFVESIRYMMTIQPIVVFFAALSLGSLYAKAESVR